jgi:hypothetical protein
MFKPARPAEGLGRSGSVGAFRKAFGEDLSPDAIGAAIATPQRSAERLLDAWEGCALPPRGLRPLEAGELRPILVQRSPGDYAASFRTAETQLDRLTGTLLYAHSAVIPDPLGDIEFYLRRDKVTAERLIAGLHAIAFAAPLVDAGVVQMVRFSPEQSARRTRGPWPTARRSLYAPGRWIQKIERKWDLFPRLESDSRPYRHFSDKAIGRNRALEVINQTNAMKGRAHLFLDDYDVDYEVVGIEQMMFQRLFAWAALREHIRGRKGEGRKLLRLLQRPLPDLSIARASDLIGIRESDRFGAFRHQLGDSLERYETGIQAGRLDVGEGIAGEFEETADALEAEVERSPALAALRQGLATLTVTGAAGLLAGTIRGEQSLASDLIAPTTAAAVELGRSLIAARRKREHTAKIAAHATAARAAAERFKLL